jgi:hypothetical protein
VEGPRAGNHGHAGEVDDVLDGRNLRAQAVSATQIG